ncbi:outer membrane protein [Vibrio sinaloensis DSM 21326]|uniref:Outer membrane protein n=1 Tax=Vibrio sinaloensis DSM 21326 TaxID=945550 RepID=E8M6Y0_PHOS4|nr:hypothetical protein [Vibrio sinaloensis]EGA70179.1 outer membrane protein [Vibrio sinaloensis DSM 21326]
MNKGLVALLSMTAAFSVMAEEQPEYLKQELYVGGNLSSYSLEDNNGASFGAHVGAKNIYNQRFIVGGELAVSGYGSSDFEKESNATEQYSIAGNIPLGVRIDAGSALNVDLYGLLGYKVLFLDGAKDDYIKGVSFGAGADLDFNHWALGLQFTQTEYDYEITENNLMLKGSYKFSF